MLNRDNAFEVSREANRLYGSSKFEVSRSLRRFLTAYLGDNLPSGEVFVFQSFAFDESYNAAQLAALHAYAQRIDAEQQEYLQEHLEVLGAQRLGTQTDDMGFGSVANGYKLPFNIATASLKQLQAAVQLVAILASQLHVFVCSPARAAGFDDYEYRGLPCSIASDDERWMIGGHDKRGGSGVLEWCYDEADARERLTMMQRYPERFTSLKAEPFTTRSGLHWAVAERFTHYQVESFTPQAIG